MTPYCGYAMCGGRRPREMPKIVESTSREGLAHYTHSQYNGYYTSKIGKLDDTSLWNI